MLIQMLRDFLRPYRKQLLIVLGLTTVQTMCVLFLPTLNADIIDNGVAKGDTTYILQVGVVMLAITFVQVACTIAAVWFGGGR